MKKYKANRKGLINYLLIGLVVLYLYVFFLEKQTLMEELFLLLIMGLPFILILWIYFDTSYQIANNELIYRSAFLRGKIKILTITEIVKGKTMWSGIRPALATKGLIIKFRKDKIYIAPKSNDELIADLLKINPDIKIN